MVHPTEYSQPAPEGTNYPARHRLEDNLPVPVVPGEQGGLLPEIDRAPEYAQLLEGLRGAVAEVAEPGAGLSELERLVELASGHQSESIPGEVLIEAVGEAHTLDARFARSREYEQVFGNLKRAVYGTEDVVPEVAKGQLHRDAQTISWQGRPIQIDTLEPNGAHGVEYEPASRMTLTLGRDYVWHVEPGAGEAWTLNPGEEEELGQGNLGDHPDIAKYHLTLRNASPLGIEAKDRSAKGTFITTERYPDPKQFRAEHHLAEIREGIDSL